MVFLRGTIVSLFPTRFRNCSYSCRVNDGIEAYFRIYRKNSHSIDEQIDCNVYDKKSKLSMMWNIRVLLIRLSEDISLCGGNDCEHVFIGHEFEPNRGQCKTKILLLCHVLKECKIHKRHLVPDSEKIVGHIFLATSSSLLCVKLFPGLYKYLRNEHRVNPLTERHFKYDRIQLGESRVGSDIG
ncbi:hypothetical protein ANN_06787 [Periplaneta americana]|uniref:Uncharacterized protein n=1 Tax=Periplaneta americana TaxID=6978 RepID=A0ABQ8TEF0_PERAM|nr:hypothetical protein ANN_06787 [Periplaneta americana]